MASKKPFDELFDEVKYNVKLSRFDIDKNLDLYDDLREVQENLLQMEYLVSKLRLAISHKNNPNEVKEELKFYTIGEVAKMLEVDRQTIDYRIKMGQIKVFRSAEKGKKGITRISSPDLKDYIKKNTFTFL